jgi:two-component system response regulator MprA
LSHQHKQAFILVVEDDRDIREAVVEVLEEEGYGVSAAGDGAQALRVLDESERQPDLILLDLMMPNMNGFEFRQHQLANAKHAAIPVAVLTADGQALRKAVELHVDGLVQKPVKIQPLLDTVERLVFGTQA